MGVAAIIASGRNSRNEAAMQEAENTMAEAEQRMKVNAARLKDLEQKANQITIKILKAIGVLEALKDKASAAQITIKILKAIGVLEARKDKASAALLDQAMQEAEELFRQLEKPLPHGRLYIGKPSSVSSLTEVTTTKNAVMLGWDDPDGGESEIHSYRIIKLEGFWENETIVSTVREPWIRHLNLESGKEYKYKIVPINTMGLGESPNIFRAKTQSS